MPYLLEGNDPDEPANTGNVSVVHSQEREDGVSLQGGETTIGLLCTRGEGPRRRCWGGGRIEGVLQVVGEQGGQMEGKV